MTRALKIENEQLFKNALAKGVNLFLGAGFSLLARDIENTKLPTGRDLRDELLRHFRRSDLQALTLPKLAAVLVSEVKAAFYEYLTKRFTVVSYDPLYDELLRLEVRRIFSTNIDNLVHQIFSQSKKNYLHDVVLHGAAASRTGIPYYPLHGCVLHDVKKYTFTPTEIASEFSRNQDDWYLLKREISEQDTLFWGYSLEDADVLQSLSDQHTTPSAHRWILLRSASEAEQAYFRSLGFQIIEGETEDLLRYVGALPLKPASEIPVSDLSEIFPADTIPLPGKIPSRPIRQFFLGAHPTWSDIYSTLIHTPSVARRIKDKILNGKHVVLVGLPLSGKTTLMMQVAASLQIDKAKLFVDVLTTEKAELIVKTLNGAPGLVFVDNFVDSIEGILLLMTSKVQVVATERTYTFDSVYFRFDKRLLDVVNVTELSAADAQAIYETIPPNIRFPKFRALSVDEQDSVFEIIDRHVSLGRIRDRFQKVLSDIERADPLSHDMLVMMSYVNECRTVVSYDMVYLFLDKPKKDYGDVGPVIERLHELVKEYDGNLVDPSQDHFVARSSAVSNAVIDVCRRDAFRRVFERFHATISPMVIPNYDAFRRYAYDHDYAKKAFSDVKDGKRFYERLVRQTDNAYDWQHGALYLAAKSEFGEAFRWIERAINKTGGRIFSIRNSHAKILFDANIPFARSDKSVRAALDTSMNTLQACYSDDRRKAYHAMRFSEQAVAYDDVYRDAKSQEYLRLAERWLEEQIAQNEWNRGLRYMLRNVKLRAN